MYINRLLIISVIILNLLGTSAVANNDLLQDAGSWLQIVGEGSLKTLDSRLEKNVSGWKVSLVSMETGGIDIKVWCERQLVIL